MSVGFNGNPTQVNVLTPPTHAGWKADLILIPRWSKICPQTVTSAILVRSNHLTATRSGMEPTTF